MRRMPLCWLAVQALVSAVGGDAGAWELYAGTNSGDAMIVGCADVGDGYQAYLCVNGTATPIDGGGAGGTCDLDNDVWVSALYGVDNIILINSYVNYSCDGASRTWGPLVQNGWTVYVTGDQDGDVIYGKGGAEVQLVGGSGGDDIYVYSGSTDSWAYGGSGNDYLVGVGGVAGEELYGESGADCLEDDASGWDVMNCGDNGVDGDTYDDNGQSGTVSHCNDEVAECTLG